MNLRIILFALMCISASTSYCQNTWIESGAKWHYNFAFFWQGLGYETLEYEKDTTINNRNYKVLKGDVYYRKPVSVSPLLYDSTHEKRDPRLVYQHGDTLWEYKNGTHVQLYNFSLAIGDTVSFMDFDAGYTSIVEDTSHTYIHDIKLRTQRIGVSFNEVKYADLNIIEKLGSTSHPTSFFWYDVPLGLIDLPEWELMCYTQDDFSQIKLLGIDCVDWPAITTDLPEGSDAYFKLGPNPVDERTRVSTNMIITQATLWTVTGQQLHEFGALQDGSEIDFSSLASGMYILQVNSQQESLYVKIMK